MKRSSQSGNNIHTETAQLMPPWPPASHLEGGCSSLALGERGGELVRGRYGAWEVLIVHHQRHSTFMLFLLATSHRLTSLASLPIHPSSLSLRLQRSLLARENL